MYIIKNKVFFELARTSIFILLLSCIFGLFIFNVAAQEYIEYQIKEGDCLWTIAKKFQLSIQELSQANDLNQEQILSPGQLIKIPQENTNDQKNKDSQITQIITHTVQKGENLWDIAQQYRLSLEDISSVNNLEKPDSLYIGQTIKIPLDKENSKQNETPDLSFKSKSPNIQGISTSLNKEFRESVKEIKYTVKPGESLWTIAQNYQVSLGDISQVNNLENEEKLSIGQIIKIPLRSKPKEESKQQDSSSSEEFTQNNWLEHIVEYGENISMIAQKYHVPIETICQLNQMSQEDYIFPGQRLKIKASDKVLQETAEFSTDNYNQQNKTDDEVITSSQEKVFQAVYYEVKSGDTLWSIAQNYGVSMESILAVNYLTNKDVLSVGQKLEIPAIGGATKNNDAIRTIEYTVVKGDTLWNIAKKYDVRMHEIISINQLKNITKLSVGQKLNIPVSGLAEEQEVKESIAVAQKEVPKDVVHYVQKGETLWEISRKYQVNLSSIASANKITENSRILVGQKLIIPNARSSSASTLSFIWPLNGLITSHFGIRNLGGRRDYHTGLDIDGSAGAPIKAAESGKVSFSGYINGYGNVVIIEHARGYSTVYAHNSSNLVKVGQVVKKGEIIARVGSTGNSTGSHLHFEVRENGKPVNPLNYLP